MTWLSPAAAKTQVVLPFTRETPARTWLGFVNEADDQPASTLMTRVLPVLSLAGVGLLVLSGGKQPHEDTPPPSSAAAARMSLAAAADAPKSPDAAQDEAPQVEAPEAPVRPAPVAPEQPDASILTPPPAPAVAAKPKRAPKPPKPLSAAAARRAARAASGLRSALADGRVKASRESFATLSGGGEEAGWNDAKAACSSLQIDGVGGWRLPSRGEAREIQRGKAAPSEAFWTRQRGPHGDTIYVHDPRTRRSAPWLDQEIARVVCVQPKPR